MNELQTKINKPFRMNELKTIEKEGGGGVQHAVQLISEWLIPSG
jgi:hypothetical protein